MFGFVRPAACRSSAPRSVTDGCPYPPLPCRAKNRNKIQLFSHRKQEINGNGGDSFHRLRLLLPPLRRSPSLEEGGLGASRALSNFLLLLRVQGRNPARFNGGYGVPRGFKGGSKPSAPCGRLSEAEHPKRKGATLLRPLSAVNRNLPGNSHSRASAPCDFRFPPCFFPHSGRMAPIPLIP